MREQSKNEITDVVSYADFYRVCTKIAGQLGDDAMEEISHAADRLVEQVMEAAYKRGFADAKGDC